MCLSLDDIVTRGDPHPHKEPSPAQSPPSDGSQLALGEEAQSPSQTPLTFALRRCKVTWADAPGGKEVAFSARRLCKSALKISELALAGVAQLSGHCSTK